MTVKELLKDKTPSKTYKSKTAELAENMIFAVGFTAEETLNDYEVASTGVTEQNGSLSAQTTSVTYLRTGEITTKTGTTREITISGDRFVGDPFQDKVLDYSVKFGKGGDVVFPYLYFNALTGVGEKGNAMVTVEDDFTGSAGETASFSCTFVAVGTPEEYEYIPTP